MGNPAQTFRVTATGEGSKSKVFVEGDIDQHADMSQFDLYAGAAEVNLKGIRRLNSLGIYPWIEAMNKFTINRSVRFVHCPAIVLDQLAIEPTFLGKGVVDSFYAPMVCPSCGEDFTQYFEVATCQIFGGKIPPLTCPYCAHVTEPDDLEEKYHFILERRKEDSKGA